MRPAMPMPLKARTREALRRALGAGATALGLTRLSISFAPDVPEWLGGPGTGCADGPIARTSMDWIPFDDSRCFLIADVACDQRLALAEYGPSARAFAAVALAGLGQRTATLWGVGATPRNFAAADVAALRAYGVMIEELLRAHESLATKEAAFRAAAESEELFRDTFERAAVGIAHTRLTGEIIRVNERMSEMLGYSRTELADISFVDITHPDDVGPNSELFMQTITGQRESYRMEKRYLRSDGTYLWTLLSVGLRRAASGQPDYLIAMIEDISASKRDRAELSMLRGDLEREVALNTEQLRARNAAMRVQVKRLLELERTQRLAEQRLRTIANNIPAMIGYWDADLRCVFANDAYQAYFGIPASEVAGMTMRELLGDTLFALNEPYVRAVLAGEPQRFERVLTRVDGHLSTTDASYLPDIDEGGRTQGFYVLVTDVSSLRAAQRALEATNSRLSTEATSDYLTGLANRRAFNACGNDAFAQLHASGVAYGLILLDLDKFKLINDTHGHDCGDDVLRSVGRVLRSELRAGDMAARIGGEEFGIVCHGKASESDLLRLAERIRVSLQCERIDAARDTIRFTASFGVACSHSDDAGFKDVYARADAAMYEAKRAGRDRVSVALARTA